MQLDDAVVCKKDWRSDVLWWEKQEGLSDKKIRSPPTNTPCVAAILDDCDGIATHRLTTCSVPFTTHPDPIRVVHHCRTTAVGASDGGAENRYTLMK